MKVGGLFSGGGGFEYAATLIGWDIEFTCEIDDFCNRILKYHFPNATHYTDITKTDFAKYRGKIDLLTGGFPCQPFSLAGSRKGKDDDRYLWPEMLRVIREIQPTWVIGENVAGITSMVQPGSETQVESQAALFEENNQETILEQQFVIETICSDLEREGYSVQPVIIPACAVCAPHRRDRIWLIAHSISMQSKRDGESGKLGSKTTKGKGDRKEWEWIRNATGNICKEIHDTNSESERLQRVTDYRVFPESWKKQQNGQSFGIFCSNWQDFPTQSPVCNGDDGISTRLDSIAFSKWRSESIKVAGNAIVPQVAVEIFKAIKKIESV